MKLKKIIQPTFGEKLFGFPITIDWSVTIILSLIVLTTNDIYNSLMWIFLYFSILLHEFGHVYVAHLFKFKTQYIKMYIFGGVANIDMDESDAKSQFFISIAGPFVNLLIYLIIIVTYFFVYSLKEINQILESPSPFHKAVFDFSNIQLLIIFFNMLPIFPMDGGRVLRAIVLWISKDLRKSNIVISYFSIGVAMLAVVFFSYYSLNIMAILIMFFIIYLNYSKLSLIKKDDIRIKNLPKEIVILTRNRNDVEELVGIYKPNPESPNIYMTLIDVNKSSVFGERFSSYSSSLEYTLQKLEEIGYQNKGNTSFDDITPFDIISYTYKL